MAFVDDADLAATGSGQGANMVGFTQDGSGAVPRTAMEKLRDTVSVMDFGAVGDGATDDSAAIQAAIDSLINTGGTVFFPAGQYRINSTLMMRSGINLVGIGASYRYDGGPQFFGSWLYYTGPVSNPAIRFRSVQDVGFWNLGLRDSERANSVGIEIGSDNNPATKRLSFRRIAIFGCYLAVRWGLANALTPLEQCDEIVFDEGSTHSCKNGFLINATNVADFSKIESWSLDALTEIGFNIQTAGFMTVKNVAAAFAISGGTMFKIVGSSADPMRIIGCQSEGAAAKFLDYNAANDQGIVLLEGNVINQPVVVNSITRVVSRNNYINAKVTTTGYVRWRSYDDCWDGINSQPAYSEQIDIGAGGQFRATTLKDAVSFFGRYLPVGFIIENGETVAGGWLAQAVTRKGVKCLTFVGGTEFLSGLTVQPTNDNGHAYLVTIGGTTGSTEPAWPTASGSTVTSGSVTFKEIGPNAILKNCGQIAV